jgi:hypothetical protein
MEVSLENFLSSASPPNISLTQNLVWRPLEPLMDQHATEQHQATLSNLLLLPLPLFFLLSQYIRQLC